MEKTKEEKGYNVPNNLPDNIEIIIGKKYGHPYYIITKTNIDGETIEYSIDFRNCNNNKVTGLNGCFLYRDDFFKEDKNDCFNGIDNRSYDSLKLSITSTHKDGTTLERSFIFRFVGMKIRSLFRNNFSETYYKELIYGNGEPQSLIGIFLQEYHPNGPFLIWKGPNMQDKIQQALEQPKNEFEKALINNGRVSDLIKRVLDEFEQNLPGIIDYLKQNEYLREMLILMDAKVNPTIATTINDIFGLNKIALPECDSLTVPIEPLKRERTPQQPKA